MSYDIFIGNAVIDAGDSDNDTPAVSATVHRIKLDAAPSFIGDEMTGNGNSRHPAYSAWSGFCESAGLLDLFFNEDTGLMREHPGCFKLQWRHLEIVRSALETFRSRNPDVKPLFAENGDERSPLLARLIWLEWWMTWALKNCPCPAVYNH